MQVRVRCERWMLLQRPPERSQRQQQQGQHRQQCPLEHRPHYGTALTRALACRRSTSVPNSVARTYMLTE